MASGRSGRRDPIEDTVMPTLSQAFTLFVSLTAIGLSLVNIRRQRRGW